MLLARLMQTIRELHKKTVLLRDLKPVSKQAAITDSYFLYTYILILLVAGVGQNNAVLAEN